MVCASGGCIGGAIDEGDDGQPSGVIARPDAGASDGSGPAPMLDAAGFDAAPPAPGIEGGLPRDAAQDASGPRDVGTPSAMEAGGGGANPEPGRLAGITAAHNAVRARVDTDTPLPPLEWSADIHAVAQAYAQKLAASCSGLVHSSSQGLGENLASTGALGASAQQAVDLWESEIECYTFGAFQGGVNATCSSACSDYGGCGHYTQIVWRKTRRVGCGVAECGSGARSRVYWVCNYDPPGNYIGQLPY